jgi:hypothetical protein
MFWERKVAPGAAASGLNHPPSNALRQPRRAFLLAWVLILLLVGAWGCGRSQSAAAVETQDDYQVAFATEPAAPVQGDGIVVITVKDKTGQPVDNAQVSIEANMNHAGMTPENAEGATGEAGIYRLPLTWTMGGAWYVDVRITLTNGETLRRRFPVDVK